MTNINIRIDEKVKNKAEKVFEELGMNMSTAVNVFLRQAIREGGIPFRINTNEPNAVTIKAIEEGLQLEKSKAVGYKSIDDLKAALEI